jgi:hypothetical protein
MAVRLFGWRPAFGEYHFFVRFPIHLDGPTRGRMARDTIIVGLDRAVTLSIVLPPMA